jgi:hypothetical protein
MKNTILISKTFLDQHSKNMKNAIEEFSNASKAFIESEGYKKMMYNLKELSKTKTTF